MPRAKKKVTSKAKSRRVEKPARMPVEPQRPAAARTTSSKKSLQPKPGQRKRGWRDIEAISERARLKKMLVDIWHEDIELDDDIFGESDHLSGYYTDFNEEEVEIEVDEEMADETEEFEEKEE